MNKKYKKQLNELGWRYDNKLSDPHYYVFKRGIERLIIDCWKDRIEYNGYEDYEFFDYYYKISHDTLKIVLKILDDEYDEITEELRKINGE